MSSNFGTVLAKHMFLCNLINIFKVLSRLFRGWPRIWVVGVDCQKKAGQLFWLFTSSQKCLLNAFGQTTTLFTRVAADFRVVSRESCRDYPLYLVLCGSSGKWPVAGRGRYVSCIWFQLLLKKLVGNNAWLRVTGFFKHLPQLVLLISRLLRKKSNKSVKVSLVIIIVACRSSSAVSLIVPLHYLNNNENLT